MYSSGVSDTVEGVFLGTRRQMRIWFVRGWRWRFGLVLEVIRRGSCNDRTVSLLRGSVNDSSTYSPTRLPQINVELTTDKEWINRYIIKNYGEGDRSDGRVDF